MPHHGRSAWPERFDYVDVADRVAGLFDADDPVALVGHSMGGKAAMVLALRHPELVERLCVVDVSPVDYDRARRVRAATSRRCWRMDLPRSSSRGDADAALAAGGARPGRCAASCSRTSAATATAGGGSPTSRCSAATSPSSAAGPRRSSPATPPYDGPVLWVAGRGLAVRHRRVRRGDGALVPAGPPGHGQGAPGTGCTPSSRRSSSRCCGASSRDRRPRLLARSACRAR